MSDEAERPPDTKVSFRFAPNISAAMEDHSSINEGGVLEISKGLPVCGQFLCSQSENVRRKLLKH